jgi:DNA methyltransferase 1-associated protein 1
MASGPRRYKKASKWVHEDRRWRRAADSPYQDKFRQYNVQPSIPSYDDETYEKHLTHQDWTKSETDYLINTFQECNGKWPVIVNHYAFGDVNTRSMEEMKSRFYSISATLLQLQTPITSMTAPEYSLFETLSHFNPKQEASRKQLAEGHLFRRQNEVDEESVLLSELQRIMLNQTTIESEREVSSRPACRARLPRLLLWLLDLRTPYRETVEDLTNTLDRNYDAGLITLEPTPVDINTQHLKH